MMQGFDVIGFSPVRIDKQARRGMIEFLRAKAHGDMGWLKNKLRRRLSPKNLWQEARSVIVLGVSYAPYEDPLASLSWRDKGTISIYARSRDYHDAFKQELRLLSSWLEQEMACKARFCVDTAPMMEKRLAQQAGIGWQGKHSNLVSRKFGSWLFLGEIMTDLPLKDDISEQEHCGNCRACLDICPTRAFIAPYRLDARRCISYLTIEHKGVIARELRPLFGNRIFGCDDCLAVCPWNKFAKTPRMTQFIPYGADELKSLMDYLELDKKSFRALFKGTALHRLGRARFLRNVLIAVGNSGNKKYIKKTTALLKDESSLVRGMAVWALSRLGTKAMLKQKARHHLPFEDDDHVRQEWCEALA